MDRKTIVLVVEDDDPSRAALCEHLALAGYGVQPVASAQEALAALQGSPAPDTVLLDLVMPDMDGFELLRRHREGQGRAAVVVLSGLSEAENVVKAMKFGAADYLPKPFDPQELELVLRRTLDSRSPARTGSRSSNELEPEANAGLVTLS